MESNGETTHLLHHQFDSPENIVDSTLNMEEVYEEKGQKTAHRFVAAIIIGISLTALVVASVVTITASVAHEPSSAIHKNTVSAFPTLNWVACIYLGTPMVLMMAQFVIWRSEQESFNSCDRIQYNKFILLIVVLIFLPTSELCLIFCLISNLLQIHCQDNVYTIRSFIHALLIPSVTFYTLKMCDKRVIGSRTLVIITKFSIVTIVITCVITWIYQLIAGAENLYLIHFNTPPKDCDITNSTSEIIGSFNKWTHYLSPFLWEFVLSCSALLYAPFHASKVGTIRPNDKNEHLLPFSPSFHRQGITIIISLIVLILCLIELGINSIDVPENVPVWASTLLGATNLTVSIISILAICILLHQIQYTKEHRIEIPADRVLLWISALGPIIKSVLHFEGSLILFQSNKTDIGFPHLTNDKIGIDLTRYLFCFVQVILQSIMLDISLRRRIEVVTPMVRMFRPALILMVANLGLWIDVCYTTPRLYLDPVYQHLYGKNVWKIADGIYQPLFSFQRMLSISLLYKIYKEGG